MFDIIKKIRPEKAVCIALCVIALAGFFFPAINIGVNFLGNSRNISLSIESLINRPENPFGSAGSGSDIASRISDLDLFDFSSDMFGGVGEKLVASVGAYFITLILLVAVLVIAFTGKLKIISAVVSAVALPLFIYAGNAILSVPELLIEGIKNSLGFFALFIDVSNMIMIDLGNGYWLTLSALCGILLLRITLIIMDFIKKNKKVEGTVLI